VIYRALYRPGPPPAPAPAARRAALQGMVFTTLRMQQSVEAGMRQAPGYLHWCLTDTNPAATRPRLAGPAGCERAAPQALFRDTPIALGGQRWLLRIGADTGMVPDAGHGNAWLFSTVGLLSTTMLAALLLTVTGRTRRIEDAVDERTADLLREATATESHQFWPDRVSLLDKPLFDWSQLLNSRQITDAYLLALAIKHGGRFVTFDHAIPLRAVTGATEQHLIRI
jgi:predicted nucleic acid-binding protein